MKRSRQYLYTVKLHTPSGVHDIDTLPAAKARELAEKIRRAIASTPHVHVSFGCDMASPRDRQHLSGSTSFLVLALLSVIALCQCVQCAAS